MKKIFILCIVLFPILNAGLPDYKKRALAAVIQLSQSTEEAEKRAASDYFAKMINPKVAIPEESQQVLKAKKLMNAAGNLEPINKTIIEYLKLSRQKKRSSINDGVREI